jgi:hypothetical protein
MFDYLDPVGSLASKNLGIPKTGVTTQADPNNIGEMIGSRIPGATGGSTLGDMQTMAQGNGETNEERKKRLAKQSGQPTTMKKGGKVKASSASKRADGCAIRGKTKGRMV